MDSSSSDGEFVDYIIIVFLSYFTFSKTEQRLYTYFTITPINRAIS